MLHFLRLLVGCACLLAACSAMAKTDKLPLPRFVSIKFSKVNMHTGPFYTSPKKWVFTRKGEPVEITAEFEQWREIRDKQGDEGWVHESKLSGHRMVIITGKKSQIIYKKPDRHSPLMALLEPEVRADLDECHKEWCRVEVSNHKGWIERTHLWGVYPKEEIDK